LFDVKQLQSDIGYVRVALVVPKFGFTAVRRNQLKRRLRELARQHVLTRPASYDLLVRARREAYEASFDRLRQEIDAVATQLS
jgi:ribonuclease P protein component